MRLSTRKKEDLLGESNRKDYTPYIILGIPLVFSGYFLIMAYH